MDEASRTKMLELYALVSDGKEGLDILSPSINIQIGNFDDTDVVDGEHKKESFAFKIAAKLKAFGSSYLKSCMTRENLTEYCVKKLDSRFKFEEEEILVRIGSCDYRDTNDKPLTLDKILEMDDLEILSQINAYQICYGGHLMGRTRYEYFFAPLITHYFKPVNDFQGCSRDQMVFQVIHDTSYILHIISENATAVIDAIIGLIRVVNSRIITSQLSIRLDIRLPPFKHDIISNVVNNFEDSTKIYESFRNRRIISSASSRDNDDEATWLVNLRLLNSVIVDKVESNLSQLDMIMEQVTQLKMMVHKQATVCEDIEIYLSDILLFIADFKNFLLDVKSPKGGYRHFYTAAEGIFINLEALEELYPIIYGQYATPSPRTPRSGLSSSRQNINTVRTSRSRSSDGRVSPGHPTLTLALPPSTRRKSSSDTTDTTE